MNRNSNAYQYCLFDSQSHIRDMPVKNTIIFPSPEYPKEKQARERIRKRRENTESLQYEFAENTPHKKQTIITQIEIPTEPQGVTPLPKQQQKPPKKPETEKVNRLVIGVICASGIAAAGMSIYHGYHYLLIAGKPSWVALITAVVMVVFSATIFSFPIKGRIVFVYALRILGFTTVSFSIFSTIAVNYDQFSFREETALQTQQINESKQAEIEILHLQIAGIEEQIVILQREAEYWKNISWARRDTANDALQNAYAERSGLWQRLSIATDNAYQVTETKTIFTYLADIFSIKKNILEFILFCVPAVFYDLLSALAVNAVLKRSNYGK